MRTLLIGVLVVVLAAGGWLLLAESRGAAGEAAVLRGQPPAATAPQLAPAAEREVDASTAPSAGVAPLVAADRPLPPHTRTGALRGRILAADGTPVAGRAALHATRAPLLLPADVSISARLADADGRFEFADVPAGRPLALRLEHGLLRALLPELAVQPGETLDVGALRLPASAVLQGTIRDETGAPMAGAEVRVSDMDSAVEGLAEIFHGGFAEVSTDPAGSTLTDAEGCYRFPAIGGGPGMVVAQAPHHFRCMRMFPPAAGGAAEVDLELPTVDDSLSIAGTLTVEDGSSPAGAWVCLQFAGDSQRSGRDIVLPMRELVAADGSFRIEAVPPGMSRLLAGRGLASLATQPISVTAGAQDVRVVLAAEPVVLLRVVDEDGEPVQGATVHMLPWTDQFIPRPDGSAIWREWPTVASADGSVRLPVPSREGAIVYATAGEQRSDVALAAANDGHDDPVLLALHASDRLRGHVLGTDGAAIEGAEVALLGPGDGSFASPDVVLSDETGLFELPAPLSGDVALSVRAAGCVPRDERFGPDANVHDLVVRLQAAGALRLVADPADTWDIDVTAYQAKGGSRITKVGLGVAVLTGLAPGHYLVGGSRGHRPGEAHDPGRVEHDVQIVAGQTSELRL